MEKSLKMKSTRDKTVELYRIKRLFQITPIFGVKVSNLNYFVNKEFENHISARKAFLALSK